MSVTYAQNFEDIMLYRCFGDKTNGFYVDVGANDPVIHSVTKKFYELGWTGINIEPSAEYFNKLVEDRPRDININCIVSSNNDIADFYEIEGTGLSSCIEFSKEEYASYNIIQKRKKSKTLDSILEEYKINQIDFLKIDVEGFEKEVLEGFSFKIRPTILLIEANKQGSRSDISGSWVDILKKNNYCKALYDGLNIFYIAKESYSQYIDFFKIPANIFDLGCTFIEELELQTKLRAINNELTSENQNLTTKLNIIYSSRGWRFLTLCYKISNKLIPTGSYRKKVVRKFYKLFRK